MGIWARTSQGLFDDTAFFYFFDITTLIDNIVIKRAITDIILLGATAIIAVWIIFDFTIVTFFNFLKESCKD